MHDAGLKCEGILVDIQLIIVNHGCIVSHVLLAMVAKQPPGKDCLATDLAMVA